MQFYNEEERFISILSDYGFKATFGNESDTRFLRKALQALINSPIAIETVSFVQNEIKGLTKDSRSGIYDLFCTDERGSNFIVEMQLGEYPEFIQRMKFYALYRLNTLIRKGDYFFENLPKIYCMGILATNIFPRLASYQNIAVLRNERGELVDDQLTFVTVELAKFNKSLPDIQTDLDKLLYTMKTLDADTQPTQFPPFWDEEWLQVAIRELDTRALTPEQRLAYEMTISANALAVKNERKKLEAAQQIGEEKAKTEVVINSLREGLSVELSAKIANVSVDFVEVVKQQLAQQR